MNASDRTKLDEAIAALSEVGGGLNIDDFKLRQIESAKHTAKKIRSWVMIFGCIFLSLAFSVIYFASLPNNGDGVKPLFVYAGIWAIALGGLGAITSIFLDILKLIPQQMLRSSDEFEVFVRIMLGVLFSFILSMTILSGDIKSFFEQMSKSASIPKQGALLLTPFLLGYSLPLVLGLLDKAIKAVELTIGIEDRRADSAQSRPRAMKNRGR
jgi:hypothetical protein